jgi:ribosome-binding factor A
MALQAAAEVQKLVTFRLGRMPETVVSAPETDGAGIGSRGNVRTKQVGAAIRKVLQEALQRGQLGAELRSLDIDIDTVEVARGLRAATVMWHSKGDDEADAEVEEAIRAARGLPRTIVARRLNLKCVVGMWPIASLRLRLCVSAFSFAFPSLCVSVSAFTIEVIDNGG